MSLIVPGGLSFSPERASSFAGEVDELFVFLTLFSFLLSLSIALLIVYFASRYPGRAERRIGIPRPGWWSPEITWIVVPTLISMFLFVRGARLYLRMITPPLHAEEKIYGVAKQWVGKLQHPEGALAIDERHIPIGRDLKLIRPTEDVVHGFYIPACCDKSARVPGRYPNIWFRAGKPGTCHLFCAESCGIGHSALGSLIVLSPERYPSWQALSRSFGTLAEGIPPTGIPCDAFRHDPRTWPSRP